MKISYKLEESGLLPDQRRKENKQSKRTNKDFPNLFLYLNYTFSNERNAIVEESTIPLIPIIRNINVTTRN